MILNYIYNFLFFLNEDDPTCIITSIMTKND